MRLEPRKIVNLQASIISDKKRHPGIIENLSKNSMYLRAITTSPASDFIPGERFEIQFKSISGEDISLPGKILWSYDTPPHGLTKSMGVEILGDNPGYKKMFGAL